MFTTTGTRHGVPEEGHRREDRHWCGRRLVRHWRLRCHDQELANSPFRFKIQEEGLQGSTWGTDTVIKNKGNQAIHIPACIEDGQYLLRAEMIALHGARAVNGAQLYVRYYPPRDCVISQQD